MRILEKTLHEDLTLNFARNLGADTYARVADIINKMERGHIEDMLKSLSEKRPKSAEVLKELLFTFDDVVNLTPKARTMIFDQVPTDRIVVALKGTDKHFRELILSSVASRVRRVVEHELGDRRAVEPARRAGGAARHHRPRARPRGAAAKSSSTPSRRMSWSSADR